MPTIGKISASLEDYVEVVYDLLQEKGKARVSDVAHRKSVKKASVNNALKRLLNEGLIAHENYGEINLTEKGLKLAVKLSERHRVIRTFLQNILKIKPKIADTDACAIEHHVHKETIDGLVKFVTSFEKKDKKTTKSRTA